MLSAGLFSKILERHLGSVSFSETHRELSRLRCLHYAGTHSGSQARDTGRRGEGGFATPTYIKGRTGAQASLPFLLGVKGAVLMLVADSSIPCQKK